MTEAPFAAVVLAAGAGRRMGGPKGLIDLGDESALERVLRVLRAAGVGRIVVVVAERDRETLRRVDLTRVVTALQPRPDAPQSSSVRIGAANLPPGVEAFFLVPVDVPLFDEEDLRALMEAWRTRPPGVAIVVPAHEGRRGHPVLLSGELVPRLRALGDDEPAHALVRGDPDRVLHVERSNPGLYRDLDEPADLEWARAQRTSGSRTAPPPAESESPSPTERKPEVPPERS